MKLIGLDIGTTNCKAGLFDEQGKVLKVSKLPTKTQQTESGNLYYNPNQLWNTVQHVLLDVMRNTKVEEICSIGVSSMAEAGLLIDQDSGKPKSEIIPWFDKRTMIQYEIIRNDIDTKEMFKKTGLYPSYKYGLNKILWLKNNTKDIIKKSVWLSVADFIVYKLTGKFGTDYSLAARTYLFRIDKKQWDTDWMDNFGLNKDHFPPVNPSGTIIGKTITDSGIYAGIPVSVAGHDHLCAALAVGAIDPGIVFDSMGTAETLVGAMAEIKLSDAEYNSGLTYGCHIVKDQYFWMGGLSAAGGSIEWFRKIIGDKALSYKEIKTLLAKIEINPSNILYYPYLSGSGAPLPDPQIKGAFIGLESSHDKGHLIKAILEGTAFEMESIRRSAVKIIKKDIKEIKAVGGGSNNPYWMKIKANVSDANFEVLSLSEATLLGAALIAAIANGLYKDTKEAIDSIDIKIKNRVIPDKSQHKLYIDIYNDYMKLQGPLRAFYNKKSR